MKFFTDNPWGVGKTVLNIATWVVIVAGLAIGASAIFGGGELPAPDPAGKLDPLTPR